MSQAYKDIGVPIGDRITRMKQSIARLEALQRYFPDLIVKSDPMKDIYQSKEIWRCADKLEILEGQSMLKVCPYKDIMVNYCDDQNSYQSEYRIYTNPMDIILIGYYFDFDNKTSISLSDRISILQVQNYMSKLEECPYTDEIRKQIEYQLYAYLKRTILAEPKRYKIENEEYLPEKLQTLITFS